MLLLLLLPTSILYSTLLLGLFNYLVLFNRLVHLPFSPQPPSSVLGSTTSILLLTTVLQFSKVLLTIQALSTTDSPHDLSIPHPHLHIILTKVLPSSQQVNIRHTNLNSCSASWLFCRFPLTNMHSP